MQFQTYRKRGTYWEPLEIRCAETARGAAQATGYVHGLKVVGVREMGTEKIIEIRFKYIPEVHHGR